MNYAAYGNRYQKVHEKRKIIKTKRTKLDLIKMSDDEIVYGSGERMLGMSKVGTLKGIFFARMEVSTGTQTNLGSIE